jgi:hypothetical protein
MEAMTVTHPLSLEWFRYLALQHSGKVYLRRESSGEIVIVVED